MDVDEQGFIRLDRYRENKKINLRKDAMFEMVNSITDLSDKYILELKLKKKHQQGDSDYFPEHLVMLRYVVFTHFSQSLYPLIYIIILRRLLGTSLAHPSGIITYGAGQGAGQGAGK